MDLPTPRDHLAAGTMDGRIYAVGGRVNGSYANNLSANEVFDPSTGEWVSAAPLPRARSGIAAATLDGSLIVVGGESPSGTFDDVDAYDAGSDSWRTLEPLPTARHGLGAVVVSGRLFVISGGPRPGGSYSSANEIYVP